MALVEFRVYRGSRDLDAVYVHDLVGRTPSIRRTWTLSNPAVTDSSGQRARHTVTDVFALPVTSGDRRLVPTYIWGHSRLVLGDLSKCRRKDL